MSTVCRYIVFSKLGCVNAYGDGDSLCNTWKNQGYCFNSWMKWMKNNCRKACNFCGGKSYSFEAIGLKL